MGLKALCQVVCQEHFPIQSVLICLALYKLYPCRSAEVQVFLVGRLTAGCCTDVLEAGNFGRGRGVTLALFMESAVDLQALIYFKGFKTLWYSKRSLFWKWKLVLLQRSGSIVRLHGPEWYQLRGKNRSKLYSLFLRCSCLAACPPLSSIE